MDKKGESQLVVGLCVRNVQKETMSVEHERAPEGMEERERAKGKIREKTD